MQEELLLPNKIVKSKRRSISLQIKVSGEFIVRAPIKCKNEEIFKFIHQKANWIIEKRLEATKQNISLKLENGEKVELLGDLYEIQLSDVPRCKFKDDKILLPTENTIECFVKLLKKLLKNYLEQKVPVLANLFAFSYSSIGVSSAKTNWGSCSALNRLHFTYKLALCPKLVVDYIIIHELCHTKIKNHSAKFWALVLKCCPDYKTQEKWLKTNRAVVELI